MPKRTKGRVYEKRPLSPSERRREERTIDRIYRECRLEEAAAHALAMDPEIPIVTEIPILE